MAMKETDVETDTSASGMDLLTAAIEYQRLVYVYDEWGKQAEGFQRWFDGLDNDHLGRFFGLVRV